MRKHLSLLVTTSFLVMGSSAMSSSFQQDDDNDMVLDQSTNGQNFVQNSENQAVNLSHPNDPKWNQPNYQRLLAWRKAGCPPMHEWEKIQQSSTNCSKAQSSSADSTAEPRAKRAKKENIEGLRETYEGFAYKELSRRVSKDPSQPMRGSVTLPTGDVLEFEFDVFSASFDMVKKDVLSFLLVNDIPAFKALRQVATHFKTLSESDDLRNLTWRIFAERTGDAEHFNAYHAPLYKALPLHQLWYYLQEGIFTDGLKTGDDTDYTQYKGDNYWRLGKIATQQFETIADGELSTPVNTLEKLDILEYPGVFPPIYVESQIKNLESLSIYQREEYEDQIRHIDVGHLTTLREFRIEGTLIRSVGGLTKLTQLESLDLADNPRLVVGPEIESLTNLWSLSIAAHQKWDPHLNFNKLTKLRYLSFEASKHIEKLPDISDLVSLEVLNLRRTNIRTLPDLTPLTSLRQIILAGTPLGALISFRD